MWYVIQVKTGEENGIARKLKNQAIRAEVPIENRPIRSGGAWTKRNIFCSRDTCSWTWISQPETITG